MGNEVSSQKHPPPPLAPLPERTGVVAALCHPYEITLRLKEQVGWSGDSFNITDINGNPSFQVKGRAMSFKQKKVLQDMNGIPILNFRHEFSLFRKYSVYTGDKPTQLVATIKPVVFLGVTADISFTDISGQQRKFLLNGNFLSSRADIIDERTRMVVGRISRQKWSANDLLWGQQT